MRTVAEAAILFLLALWLTVAAQWAHGAERPVYVAMMIVFAEDGWSKAQTVAYGDTPVKCEEQARVFIAKHGATDYTCEPIRYSEFEKIADWLQFLEGQGKTVLFQNAGK